MSSTIDLQFVLRWDIFCILDIAYRYDLQVCLPWNREYSNDNFSSNYSLNALNYALRV